MRNLGWRVPLQPVLNSILPNSGTNRSAKKDNNKNINSAYTGNEETQHLSTSGTATTDCSGSAIVTSMDTDLAVSRTLTDDML